MKKLAICLFATASTLTIFFSFSAPERSKTELGRLLFFDPILSKDSSVSCASCHRPEYAFADTSAVSLGVGKLKGTRNTPSAMNVLLQRNLFWDGRATTLEEQALAPISNPVEMNLAIDDAVRRLQRSAFYSEYFRELYAAQPSASLLAQSIAAFERTLETSESPFDDWKFSDKPEAVSESVKRGFELFNGKGKCNRCHFGADFTANEFRNIGLFNGKNLNDSGRLTISGRPEDIGKFKTPPLRNVAITAPYMHNGIFSTLREVIDFYNDPARIVPDAVGRDTILAKPLGLSDQEKVDLEAMLISITDKRFDDKRASR